MKKSLVIVAAALVFASACQKEQLVPEGNFSIKATREACVDTKATVSDAGAFAWVPNDAIGVYNGTGFSELTTTGSGASATFTGTVVGTPQTCAIFPYSVTKSTTSVTLPDSYVWKDGDAPTPMYAEYNASGLSFKHLGGLIKVTVTGVPTAATKFVFEADKDITGVFDITAGAISSSALTDKGKVEFTFAEGTASTMSFYVPVPVGTYTPKVSLKNASDTELWSFAGSTPNKVTRAKLIVMPTLTIASVPGSGEGSATSVTVPENYNGTFYLPETSSDVYVNMGATTNPVIITYKDGATAKPANVYIDCGTNVIPSFTVNLPASHVELTGNEYTTLVSFTSLSTLVIKQGTKVNTLNVSAGSVDVQGEVADMSISNTVENDATVRISDEGKVTSSIKNDSQATIQKSADNTTTIPTPTGSGKTDVSTANSDAANEIVKTLSEGGSVTLTENLDLYEPVEIFGTTNLALGGFTVSAKHTDEFVFAVHNGATFNITGTGTIDGSNNVLAIKLTVKGDDPSSPAVLKITGEKTANRVNIKGEYYAISGNGNRHNTDVVLKFVNCYASKGTAIYQPQVGKLTMSSTLCEGLDSGVEIRSGEASLNPGCMLTANSESFVAEKNGNGTTVSGAALVVSQHTTNKPIHVEIKGGTFSGAKSVFFGDLQDEDQTDVSLSLKQGTSKITCSSDIEHLNGDLTLNGGTYEGDINHKGGSLIVTNGTFNKTINQIGGYILLNGPATFKNALNIEDGSEHFIVCGSFPTDPDEKYISPDSIYKFVKSDNTLFKYSDTIGQMSSSGTLYLLRDATSASCLALGSNTSIVFEMNGHTLSSLAKAPQYCYFNRASGSSVTFKNGKLIIPATVTNVAISAINTNKVILEDGFTMETPVGGVLLEGTASLVMKAGSKIVNTGSDCSAVYTNGNNTMAGSSITIEGGTIESNGLGIYNPGAGTLTISGGEISGQTAVYVKSGTTTITGGTFSGTGAKAEYSYNSNGCNLTGDAFVVDNCGISGGVPVVSVTGGTFNSTNAAAIASYAGNGQSEIVKNFIAKTGVTLTPALESTSELWAE